MYQVELDSVQFVSNHEVYPVQREIHNRIIGISAFTLWSFLYRKADVHEEIE